MRRQLVDFIACQWLLGMISLPFVSIMAVGADYTILTEKITCNCTRCENQFCETEGGCQKVLSRNPSTGQVEVLFDCVSKVNWQPPEKPLSCQPSNFALRTHNVACCQENFCNGNLNITLDDLPPSELNQALLIALPICFTLLIVLAVGLLYYCLLHRRGKTVFKRVRQRLDKAQQRPLLEDIVTIRTMLDAAMPLEEGTNSGSGSGLPILVQRTVARQIQLKDLIGRGRYGEVWVGTWRNEQVAVKIFSSRDEKSWIREVEIYTTTMLRHENILGFIAADNKDSIISTQLWLVTEYHPPGSLYDYLTEHPVDMRTMCLMSCNIAAGLAHLHTEISGTHSKPAIAHRDLKSKNILVRRDLSCCIGDLGLAVRYDSQRREINLPDNAKVGTRRYLPPEVLNDTMHVHQFDAYKQADVYALGLVLWEIARRTSIDGLFEAYELPYFEYVSYDPAIEEMRRVVVDEQKRPTIPNRWKSCPPLEAMSKLMSEAWRSNPEARLTALRIKKNIAILGASATGDDPKICA